MMEDRALSTPLIESIAKRWYSEKKFAHVMRVADLTREDPRVVTHEPDFRVFCYQLAICHDLYEDTDIPRDAIDDKDLDRGIQILTHDKANESYADYCKRISCRDNDYFMDYVDLAAWYVKLNDMKDHLQQKKTLTDKLKEKYLEGMMYLL